MAHTDWLRSCMCHTVFIRSINLSGTMFFISTTDKMCIIFLLQQLKSEIAQVTNELDSLDQQELVGYVKLFLCLHETAKMLTVSF